MIDPNELADRFAYHQPKDDATREAHERVRTLCDVLAANLNELLPDGRHKTLAVTALEEAMHWGERRDRDQR